MRIIYVKETFLSKFIIIWNYRMEMVMEKMKLIIGAHNFDWYTDIFESSRNIYIFFFQPNSPIFFLQFTWHGIASDKYIFQTSRILISLASKCNRAVLHIFFSFSADPHFEFFREKKLKLKVVNRSYISGMLWIKPKSCGIN